MLAFDVAKTDPSRALRVLPALEARRRELELCTYCPKLCRAVCPVSNAEPRESLIPWGKMQGAFLAARGDLPLTEDVAMLPFACTGCGACTKACDHENPVAATLRDARAALHDRGAIPPAVRRVIERFSAHDARTRRAVAKLREGAPGGPVKATMLVGCAYARALPDVARDLVRATRRLVGGEVRLVSGCCGVPLRDAGDRDGHRRAVARLRDELGEDAPLVVGDPGCAAALAAEGIPAESFVVLAHRALGELSPLPPETVTYHDPCTLGRGLGIYDEPRDLLARIFGAPPGEFLFSRERSACSGQGGLLPTTMPEVAAGAARARARGAPGHIVTACAKSVLGLRRAGARVTDLATLVARSLDAGR